MVGQQTQLPLNPPPPVLRVIDDYGPVGKGVSQAHFVLAENLQEYMVKGPSLVPTHPHVAANEYVAARLAQTIGLPILDFTVVELAGELCFASAWMSRGTFYPETTEALFDRCENRDRLYDLVVFDAWIANIDRHAGNLLVREVRPRGAENPRRQLLCNDHSHCLIRPRERANVLKSRLDAPPRDYISISFVINSITEAARLTAALDRVGQIQDGTIGAAIAEMPATFVPSAPERALMQDYLLERRDRLATIFRTHRATFPRLKGQL